MKDTLFEMLIDLFHEYIDNGNEYISDIDKFMEEIDASEEFELAEKEGYEATTEQEVVQTNPCTRLFNQEEQYRLSPECCGFIHFIENLGVMTPKQREEIIHEALEISRDTVTLDHLKWLSLAILANGSMKRDDVIWWESILFHHEGNRIKH